MHVKGCAFPGACRLRESVPEYVVVIIDGSCSCQSSDEELDGGDEEPSLRGSDEGLEVLGEPPVPVGPSERAFDPQRRGRSWKPLVAPVRLTICTVQGPVGVGAVCGLEPA